MTTHAHLVFGFVVVIAGCANGGGDKAQPPSSEAGEDTARPEASLLFETEGDSVTDTSSAVEVGPCADTVCGTSCVNLKTDQDNCGKCGRVCPSGESCVSGSCACIAPRRACPSGCTNITKDPDNCGGCGVRCVDPSICKFGSCT